MRRSAAVSAPSRRSSLPMCVSTARSMTFLPRRVRRTSVPLRSLGSGRRSISPALFHAVEPLGHPARGEKGRAHEACRVELVGCAGTAQRGEEVEPALLQPVLRESLRELVVGEMDDAEEPAVEAERSDVQVGALPPPLRQDLVHVVLRLAHRESV